MVSIEFHILNRKLKEQKRKYAPKFNSNGRKKKKTPPEVDAILSISHHFHFAEVIRSFIQYLLSATYCHRLQQRQLNRYSDSAHIYLDDVAYICKSQQLYRFFFPLSLSHRFNKQKRFFFFFFQFSFLPIMAHGYKICMCNAWMSNIERQSDWHFSTLVATHCAEVHPHRRQYVRASVCVCVCVYTIVDPNITIQMSKRDE